MGITYYSVYKNSTGIVGIGTSSPAAKLDIRQTSAATGLKVFTNDTSTAYIAQFIGYDNSLGDTTRMVVQAGGNVGIGTTSPSYKLDLSTTLTGTTVGSNVVLNIESQASGRDVEIRLGDTVNATKRLGYLSGNFYIATGTTENFRIDTSGNVGIGTTSPAYKLEVASGTSGQQSLVNFRTADSTTANNAGIQIFATPSATATSREAVMALDADGANASGGDYFLIKKRGNSGTTDFEQYSNASMRFGTNFISRATYDMTIANDGNVGIGTTSPSQKLEVNGTVLATAFSGPLTGNVTGNATNVTGTVAIANGGTGATTAADARTNLGISNSYLYAKRTTSQSIASGVWAYIDIIFSTNSASSGIAYNTSTGVASLTAGKVYRITAGLEWSRSGANSFMVGWNLCNNADNSVISPEVYSTSATWYLNLAMNPTLDMILAPSSNIDVKIRTVNNNGYGTDLVLGGNNYFIIQQIA